MQSLLASLPSACRFAMCACDWPGIGGLVARLVSYTSCDQVHPIPRPPPHCSNTKDGRIYAEMMSLMMSSMRLLLITLLAISLITSLMTALQHCLIIMLSFEREPCNRMWETNWHKINILQCSFRGWVLEYNTQVTCFVWKCIQVNWVDCFRWLCQGFSFGAKWSLCLSSHHEIAELISATLWMRDLCSYDVSMYVSVTEY